MRLFTPLFPLPQGLFTALDPDVATPDPTLQDAFIQAGAFTLLVPMLSEPIAAAQIWAAEIFRALVFANQATKRALNVHGGLTRLFEALGGGNPGVQTAVLRCLGEELYEASELSVVGINKMGALKLLTQCVLHGEAAVQVPSVCCYTFWSFINVRAFERGRKGLEHAPADFGSLAQAVDLFA